MKITGNPDWTNPLVRAKNAVAGPARRALARAGRWTPKTAVECETVETDALTLDGDKPPQRRLVFANERPATETVENLRYTPEGMAIVDGLENGKIIERYSVRAPSIPEILTSRKRPPGMVGFDTATIIEAETPYTYGDWVGDFICSIVMADAIAEPVVLPQFLVEKSYVTRDLARLGLTYAAADTDIMIDKAHVLRKRLPSYYWSEKEVAAYRKAFKINPPEPTKDFFTYLGRFGTISESVQRQYPSEVLAKIVESLGGNVFDARTASPDLFNEMAYDMETVIADQGSALFGVMHWRTKNVIELTRRDWWHNANLFIAKASGVENYAVVEIDDLGEPALRERIEWHLRKFGVLS